VIRDRVLALLRQVADGQLDINAALDRLARDPLESLPFATIDHHRALRQGYPEVVLGLGKTTEQIVAIAERVSSRGEGFLVTRAAPEALMALGDAFPGVEINALGRCAYLAPAEPVPPGRGTILIVTAGTSDLPVAEEAAVTARALGNSVDRLTDVGVAGIHRVLAGAETLTRAAVVIVVAGMDGALPSVVGGLVATPVIAVPTSVGYGASFGGVAALLAALNSCASGVTVVNIDNGFGAAVAASRITHASIS
jgi:NCAIR mutase (PurE)-related protein